LKRLKLPTSAYRQAHGGAFRKGDIIYIVPLDPAYPAIGGMERLPVRDASVKLKPGIARLKNDWLVKRI